MYKFTENIKYDNFIKISRLFYNLLTNQIINIK